MTIHAIDPGPQRLSFVVPGEAVPQGSHKGFVVKLKSGKQRAVVTNDNNRTTPWRLVVASAALEAMAQSGTWPCLSVKGIRLDINVYFVRPQSVSERRRPLHTVKPDASKLLRAIEDALTKILWVDDAQICDERIAKSYAPKGEPAHVSISVYELIAVGART